MVEGMTRWDSSSTDCTAVDECATSRAHEGGARGAGLTHAMPSAVAGRTDLANDAGKHVSEWRLRATACLMTVLLACFPAVLSSQAFADESPSDSASATPSASSSSSTGQNGDSGMTVTDSITDTQNLLGSQASLVNDTIAKTKSDTGVTVRLLYLSTFSGNSNPEKWTSAVLESTDPPVNTVLLAVASQDGNLVVAVSGNSEQWLQQQSTVDELSDAALKPITEGSTPDWANSAIDMMTTLTQIKQTSTNSTAQHLGTTAFIAVLVILLIAACVMFALHQRRKRQGEAGTHDDRRTRDSRRSRRGSKAPTKRQSNRRASRPRDGRGQNRSRRENQRQEDSAEHQNTGRRDDMRADSASTEQHSSSPQSTSADAESEDRADISADESKHVA